MLTLRDNSKNILILKASLDQRVSEGTTIYTHTQIHWQSEVADLHYVYKLGQWEELDVPAESPKRNQRGKRKERPSVGWEFLL